MPSRQRYVVVGILGMAVLVALALSHGFQWVWVQFGWDDFSPLNIRELPLTTLLAYAFAAGAAVVCLKHATVSQLAGEVVDELARVTWPSREETGSATGVVIATVVVCAVYLGVFDAFWLWLTDLILAASPVTSG